jgi:hypothetical protein
VIRKLGPPLSSAGDGRAYGVKGEPFKNVGVENPRDAMRLFTDGLAKVMRAAKNDAPAPPRKRRKRKRVK